MNAFLTLHGRLCPAVVIDDLLDGFAPFSANFLTSDRRLIIRLASLHIFYSNGIKTGDGCCKRSPWQARHQSLERKQKRREIDLCQQTCRGHEPSGAGATCAWDATRKSCVQQDHLCDSSAAIAWTPGGEANTDKTAEALREFVAELVCRDPGSRQAEAAANVRAFAAPEITATALGTALDLLGPSLCSLLGGTFTLHLQASQAAAGWQAMLLVY